MIMSFGIGTPPGEPRGEFSEGLRYNRPPRQWQVDRSPPTRAAACFAHGIPRCSLWRPGWTEPDRDDFRARVAHAHSGDYWISDGSYAAATFDLRLPRADALIVLERPRWLCLARVLWRSLSRRERIDLPEGCSEHVSWDFLKFVWRFDKVSLPRIEAARVAHGRDVPVIRLSSNRQIAGFLESQPAERTGYQKAEGQARRVD